MKTQYYVILLMLNLSFHSGINMEELQEISKEEKAYLSRNITSRSNGKFRFDGPSDAKDSEYGFETSGNGFKFEEDGTDQKPNNPGRITFQESGEENIDNYIQNFPEDGVINVGSETSSPGRVTFQDDNSINNSATKKKKRRRRRRPRYQGPQIGGVLPFPGPQSSAGLFPTAQNSIAPFPYPQYPVPPGSTYPGSIGTVLPYPGFENVRYPPGQYYKRPRRPKSSFASEALSAVTGALTSIAMYDDYQCVPRLLCEAAGGGALGASGVLQSISGLQPLLTLLSAYNGISSSPLFVFGRAVFLGMTSKMNTASCRYAYPQCPTDPEQLVHYLNNHNGGFFRFFNSPTQQNPQNLDQFYQQLSFQGQYGLVDQHQTFFPALQNTQNLNQFNQQQSYGLYEPQSSQPGLQQFQNGNQNLPGYGFYGLQPNQFLEQNHQNYGLHKPHFQTHGSLYFNSNIGNNYLHNYGKKYPHNKNYGSNTVKYKGNLENSVENKIQRRIQNKPNKDYIHSVIENMGSNLDLKFPSDNRNQEDDISEGVRGGKILKFPEETKKNEGNTITFPELVIQNLNGADRTEKIIREQINYPNFNLLNSLYNYIKNYSQYYGNAANFDKYANDNSQSDEGVQTVYVVRGNGDPNHPEVIKIRPGEKINL